MKPGVREVSKAFWIKTLDSDIRSFQRLDQISSQKRVLCPKVIKILDFFGSKGQITLLRIFWMSWICHKPKGGGKGLGKKLIFAKYSSVWLFLIFFFGPQGSGAKFEHCFREVVCRPQF